MARILCIALADDDDAIREWISCWLWGLGHEVLSVEGGQQLVDACLARPPDLIISDLQMPDMDGLTAALVLRRHFVIPTIFLSGGWQPEWIELANQLGIQCLQKPVSPRELFAAIERAVGSDDFAVRDFLPELV